MATLNHKKQSGSDIETNASNSELNFLVGVSSNVQDQLNDKLEVSNFTSSPGLQDLLLIK